MPVPFLLRLLSRWPLSALHALGWGLGWLTWLVSSAYRQRWSVHTRYAGLQGADRWASVGEAGKQVAELPRLWLGAPVSVGWEGAAHIEAALAHRQGVLFLTPHLGCFEITAQAYAARFGGAPHHRPITVLYRPPRKAALRPVLAQARERPGLHAAPTNLGGVKQLMQALRQGDAVGLLPDQVPPAGMGVWAPFFGQSAYTMTLSSRLAQVGKDGQVALLVAWGERLPAGRGFVVHVEPLEHLLHGPLSAEPQRAAEQINAAMETVIRRCPQQYLWGYARYKAPRAPTVSPRPAASPGAMEP